MLWFWSFGLNGLLLFDFVRLCAGEVVCSFEGWSLVLDRAGSMIDVDVIVPLRTTDGLSSAAELEVLTVLLDICSGNAPVMLAIVTLYSAAE